jgi:uncharacterized membrane protein (UPF0127 family)
MLVNETKGKVWQGRVELADNFLKRFRGLMLRMNIGNALVFILPEETRINASNHMFFMFSDIDVIWLDSERRVVDFKTAKKWRLYSPKKPAKYISEGPVGIIKTLEVGEGDVISWTLTKERNKAVPVKISLPEKITFESTNGITMTESVKEAKVERF